MENLAQALARIAARYRLRDVYVFGSRAAEIRGRVKTGEVPEPTDADVDVGVQPETGHTLNAHDRVKLTVDLEDLLDAPRVDLVVLSEARPGLAVDVVKGELLYTSDPRAQAEHELYILRRAADLAPFARARIRSILMHGAR